MSFRFPKELELLELYLRQKGVDPDTFKNERHALQVLLKESGLRRRFPKRGKPTLPVFESVHQELFSNVTPIKARRKSRRRGIGTVGPASKVRSVSDEVRVAVEAKLNPIVIQ